MDVKRIYDELKGIAERISDPTIRAIVLDLLTTPRLSIADVKPLVDLFESPAAPRKHHMFPGGLLLHTLAVVRLAIAIAEVLEQIYGVKVDRDLVIAAAILHDLFKVYQYVKDEIGGGYRAREDWYMSHDYAMVAELGFRRAPEKLIRAVSEVHGTTPITMLESLAVHLADTVDARIGEYLQNLVLAKAKDVEQVHGCKQVVLFIEAMKKLDLAKMFNLAISNPDELRKIFENICTEMKSMSKQHTTSSS